MNLMIGTDPAGKGGIASVITVFMASGFLQQYAVRYLCSHAESGLLKKLVLFVRTGAELIKYCIFSRPCIVHVHAASHASFIRKALLLAVARSFGCKTIFHLHGGGFKRYVTEESGAVMQAFVRATLERSSQVIALSDQWAGFLCQFAPKAKVMVLANSVVLTDLCDGSNEQDGRILFLGRIDAQKGIFELLAAIALLKPTYPAIKLIIAGEGDFASVQYNAQALGIAACVECLGWIDNEQKAQELQKACIFTLPSHAEGLPMSMLEAMSAGKAIVVSNVGGIPSVVHHQISGLLVQPGQVAELAAALGQLLGDKALRTQLAKNARQLIEDHYSSRSVLDRLALLYDDLSGITSV